MQNIYEKIFMDNYFPNDKRFSYRLLNLSDKETTLSDENYAYCVVEQLLKSSRQGKNTSPDFYSINKQTAYIFEHFSFASSEVEINNGSRKGLKGIKNPKLVENKFREESLNKESYTASYSLDAKQSAKSYIDNLIYYFKSHYSKISQYKQNILNENKDKNIEHFVVTFIIEDRSLLTNVLKGINSTNEIVEPSLCKEFLKILDTHFDVDNIIFCQKLDTGKNVVTFLKNAKNGIMSKANGTYSLVKKGIKEFNPQLILHK